MDAARAPGSLQNMRSMSPDQVTPELGALGTMRNTHDSRGSLCVALGVMVGLVVFGETPRQSRGVSNGKIARGLGFGGWGLG